MFDIIIVGAGPTGCRTAELISKYGYSVMLIEEHRTIGKPVQCAGLVSWRLKQLLPELPQNIILNIVNRAKFFSPSTSFELKSKKPMYVIDRSKLDKYLYKRARTAEVKLGVRFISFARSKDSIKVKTTKGVYETKLLIGADGANSIVAKQAGLRQPSNRLIGVQTTVSGEFDTVELWFGKEISPEFFGWVVPTGRGKARIGVATKIRPKTHFQKFLELRVGKIKQPDVAGTINFGLMDTAAERVLLVGDAACQVKPFSIDAEEPIVLKKDGLIRTQKISEFVNQQMKNSVIKVNTGHQEFLISKPKKSIFAYSIDKNANSLKFRKINNVLKHKIDEELYEIILERGFRIKATGSHSIMTIGKNKIIPKNVSELKPKNDYLLVTLNVPNNESLTKINLIKLILQEAPELIPEIRVKGGKKLIYSKRSDIPLNLRTTYWDRDSIPLKCFLERGVIPKNVKLVFEPQKKKVEIPNVIKITPEFCRLLGYYVADGDCYAEKHIHMSFGKDDYDNRIVDDFIYCVKKVFGVHVSRKQRKNQTKDEAAFQFSFGEKLLARIFVRVFKTGKKAHSKQVPFIIFNVPNQLKLEFLKGYLRGNGSLRIRTPRNRGNWCVELSAKSVSYKLISDLIILSFQCGLLPSVSEDISKTKTYRICFSNKKDLKKLLDVFPNKKKRLLNYLNKIKSKSVVNLPNGMLKEFESYRGYKTYSYYRLKNVLNKGKINNLKLNLIKNIVNNKIWILPIKSIKRVKGSKNEVFDIEISGTNTFVGGLGPIVLHNSGGGVIYGLIGAGYCARACIEALKKQKFSAEFLRHEYDDVWKAMLAKPIKRGLFYTRLLHGKRLKVMFAIAKILKPIIQGFDVDLLS